MRSLLLATAATVAPVAPSQAQKMGSTNSDAPTVSQSVTWKNGKMASVKYFAITIAEGRFMKMVKDPERGERFRSFMNGRAESNPLGHFKATTAMMLGGKAVPAGDYKMYFTMDNDMKWHLNLAAKDGDHKVSHKLNTQDGGHSYERLSVMLMPGKGKSCKMLIGFGKTTTMVKMTGGKKKATSRKSY